MINDYQFVDGSRLSTVIEALIFASDEPISGTKIRDIITDNEEQIEIDEDTVSGFVDKLNERYDENGLSFRIERMGGGYTFVTRQKFHYWLSIYQHENAYRKLSQSAIESLAIVAYRQPITKPEVDQIRGVDSGYILRQLMEKALIEVAGRADSPGKPLLYRTTRHFLRHFGINSVDELPKPREIEEILKDDDMAEHRQLLMERQLMLEELEEHDDEEIREELQSILSGETGNGESAEGEAESDEDSAENSGSSEENELSAETENNSGNAEAESELQQDQEQDQNYDQDEEAGEAGNGTDEDDDTEETEDSDRTKD